MNRNPYAPITKSFNIDGSTSVTLFPSVTSQRWNLTGVFIGWNTASASSAFTLKETWDSASAAFFRFNASTSQGATDMFFGGWGIDASAHTSGLVLAVDVGATGTGSYSGVFTGYYTGG